MKRIGNLFERIVSYENLHLAYLNARRGKRYRNEVVKFTNNLETNLFDLQRKLTQKEYRVGKYRTFFVREPKKRLVMALPFEDRVVQWAVYQLIEPILNKRFIEQSYACRKGKGSHRAAADLQKAMRKMERSQYGKECAYLKADVSKYFYRVDHDVLLSILGDIFKDVELLDLLALIIKSDDMMFGMSWATMNLLKNGLKE